jgi:glycosyltransferase involved in cell wall biosynthesis
MKVIGLLHVKNEEDILGKALDVSAPLLDGIVALDNGSTDATREILMANPRILEILSDDGPLDDGRFTDKLVRAADKFRADWYCIFDADEFLEKPGPVRKRLERLRPRFNVMRVNMRYCLECDPKKCYKINKNWLMFYRNLGLDVLLQGIKDIKALHTAKCPIPISMRVEVSTKLDCLHFQCRTFEQTMRKYKQYLIVDPRSEYQRVGYGHFLDAAQALKTRDFSGFKFLP